MILRTVSLAACGFVGVMLLLAGCSSKTVSFDEEVALSSGKRVIVC